jgi:aspartate aminotransferase
VPTDGLALRTLALKASPTLAITAKAKRLRAEGRDVLSLAAGEPDFSTPEPVCEAAVKAMRDGLTKYTPSAGMLSLREAVSEKLSRENGIQVPPDGVVVTCGAKHAVYGTLMALIDPGDEVIVIAPFWMTYIDQVSLAGGVPVVVESRRERGYVPDIERIEEAVTPKTKAVIVNFPCNPTGAAVDREWLERLASVALSHGLWVLSDEIYEKLVYDGHVHVSLASLSPEVAQRTVTVNGLSKTYAMTGWRIGYLAAPVRLAQAVSTIQDQVTSNATSIAQAAAVAALGLPEATVESMRREFLARRDLMVGLVREVPGLQCTVPMGAFYVLADAARFLAPTGGDDERLADWLLDRARVATVPGSVFRAPGCLRLSFACGQDEIREAMSRISEALCSLPQ